jgi:hypothetical protein
METDSESTSRLRAMITAVDGKTDKGTIWKFVDSLLVRDARFLREQYKTRTPDVDFNINVECDCSSEPLEVRLPIGVNFFWPDANV